MRESSTPKTRSSDSRGPAAGTAFRSYLAWYVPRAQRKMEGVLREARRSARSLSPEVARGIDAIATMLQGGKRLRGALVQIGYECAGNQRRFLSASVAYELAHAFLLIHDDIMDRADVRRGRPTLHRRYAVRLARRRARSDAAHLGTAVGITLGDLVFFWALQVFAETAVPAERRVRALRELGAVLGETAHGQLLDVLADWRSTGGSRAALDIAERKTARYSVVGPLVVGALLGGGSRRICRALARFGQPLGLAFQLRDDLLGLYGDEGTTGKSSLSDLREGKPTYLIATAYRRASQRDRAALESLWGKRTATARDLSTVRTTVDRTGVRADVERLIRRLVRRGVRVLSAVPVLQHTVAVLHSFARFVEGRSAEVPSALTARRRLPKGTSHTRSS